MLPILALINLFLKLKPNANKIIVLIKSYKNAMIRVTRFYKNLGGFMELNTLYFLMRLYSLCESLNDGEDHDFKDVFEKIKSSTDGAIVSKIPQNILDATDALSDSFSSEGLCKLLDLLLPYKEQCESFLPNLKEENEEFMALASEALLENGYFLKGGIFRKVRGSHLYIIECELTARFMADELGRVVKIAVTPYIRVADTHVKQDKTGAYTIAGAVSDDEATVTDAKLYDKRAFYKTLRHLETLEFNLDEKIEITSEQLAGFGMCATLAAAVCENRAIPSYYKKLIRNDIPFGKALTLSLFSGGALFVLLTLCLALLVGLAIYFIFGFKLIWGLLLQPYYYMFTAIVSLIYAIAVFKKTRSGR